MGEVYRAQDSRLKRVVAVKIVPDAMAGELSVSPDSRGRRSFWRL
jgi:hypothetical protein